MRTTVVLDDDLFRMARKRAAEEGRSLSELVSRALREALREPAARPSAPFRMPTFGGPVEQRHEPADLAAALEEEDRARVGH